MRSMTQFVMMLPHQANWVLCFDFVKTHAKHDPICHKKSDATWVAFRFHKFCITLGQKPMQNLLTQMCQLERLTHLSQLCIYIYT